ncbi:MAG: insulinase family protein [Elusimicrobiota bacterium]|jgi:predicted Zn-dependent peptidase|nr:insulinase family protein [Elusimicrobiota bacterium]
MKVWKLKNNIRVLFKRTRTAQVVCMDVFTPVSVSTQNVANAGIANLTANVMSKATLTRPAKKLACDIENIGVSLLPSMYYDYAYLEASFLPEYFDKAAEIFADIIINPAFNKDDIEIERNNVLALLSSQKDSISTTARSNFLKHFYGDNPYSNPIVGTKESILAIDDEQIRQWHKKAFNSQNLIFSIAGNIDENKAYEIVEKHFGQIESGQKFQKPVFKQSVNGGKEVFVTSKFNQGFIFMGYEADNLYSKHFEAGKVVAEILGGRMTSRLFVELREKLGLAYDVGASYPARVWQSYFGIYIGLDKKNIEMTLKRIDKIVKNFCSKQMSDQELNGAKNYMRGVYSFSRQTVADLAYVYGANEILGFGWKYEDQYLDRLSTIKAIDVYKAANLIFEKKPTTVVLR